MYSFLGIEESNYKKCQKMMLCASEPFFVSSEGIFDHERHITAVNSANTTWTAGHNAKFAGMTLSEIRQHLGTVVDSDWTVQIPTKHADGLMSLPTNFTVAEKWPECASVINHVRD